MLQTQAIISFSVEQLTKLNKKSLRTIPELVAAGIVPATAKAELEPLADKYAISITPQIAELFGHAGVRDQFVPTANELITTPQELADPIGDNTFSPLKGIVHRYPDRCLLQPVNVCPVYCRFCFRREVVGNTPGLTPDELTACYAYIKANPQIWEVILSGGDPLILKPQHLQQIFDQLRAIEHVQIIRIHTRVPMVDSPRIDQQMLTVLKSVKPLYIVLHINHPDEFSALAIRTVEQLADAGIILLAQSVLLKNINDNFETLSRLFRTMIKHRIKPYYLHHTDLAKGTAHFRTTIEHGQQLMRQLRGNLSGICLPEYILDIPGGAGKIPIGPNFVRNEQDVYKLRNYLGQEYSYIEDIPSN